MAGSLATRAILRDYISATIDFEELSDLKHTPPKSLMRMLGPKGNPQARNLFEVIAHLQRTEALSLRTVAQGVDAVMQRKHAADSRVRAKRNTSRAATVLTLLKHASATKRSNSARVTIPADG